MSEAITNGNKHNLGKKYMRAKEVAAYLGIGLSTVFHYVRVGKLHKKKISPRVTIFEIKEVEALCNAETTC